jgi:hypothetical protein
MGEGGLGNRKSESRIGRNDRTRGETKVETDICSKNVGEKTHYCYRVLVRAFQHANGQLSDIS